MADDVEQSTMKIAGLVATDVSFIASPDQKDFDPVSLAFAFGGLLLTSYLQSFVKEARGGAEQAGEESARWLRERIRSLFKSQPDTRTDEVRDAANAAGEIAGRTSADDVDRYAEASQKVIEKVLIEQGFSSPKASGVAAQVRTESDRLIASLSA